MSTAVPSAVNYVGLAVPLLVVALVMGFSLPNVATVVASLGALRTQDYDGALTVLLVDTGSTDGTVELAEIAGSDTFVHVSTGVGELVAQLTGVHDLQIGSAITLYLSPGDAHAFDAGGALLVAPKVEGIV